MEPPSSRAPRRLRAGGRNEGGMPGAFERQIVAAPQSTVWSRLVQGSAGIGLVLLEAHRTARFLISSSRSLFSSWDARPVKDPAPVSAAWSRMPDGSKSNACAVWLTPSSPNESSRKSCACSHLTIRGVGPLPAATHPADNFHHQPCDPVCTEGSGPQRERHCRTFRLERLSQDQPRFRRAAHS